MHITVNATECTGNVVPEHIEERWTQSPLHANTRGFALQDAANPIAGIPSPPGPSEFITEDHEDVCMHENSGFSVESHEPCTTQTREEVSNLHNGSELHPNKRARTSTGKVLLT
jgi:hypothetical protein